MKTKKVVRMPLRRNPATGKSRSTPTLRARAATADAHEEDYESGEEPNMRFSHALIVVLILHLIAVGGVFAFNWMKARQGEKVGSSAVATSSGGSEATAPEVTAKSAAPTTDVAGWSGRTHTVAAGDTLTRIASTYGVTISAIEAANGIDNYSMIRVGQVLKIPALEPTPSAKTTKVTPPADKTSVAKSAPAAANTPSSAQQAFLATQPQVKKAVIAAVPTDRVVAKAVAAPAETVASNSSDETVYEVMKGDNPYSIAKKFHVSYNQLIEINGITDPTKIQIGQKLKIPAK